MKVTMIGSGNVATVLCRLILSAGHSISAIISRNLAHAPALAQQCHAAGLTEIPAGSPESDLYIIAVADTAIPLVAAGLRVPGKMVVHTSGSVSKDVLQESSDAYGVLYPLQSLRKELSYIPEIPFMVDGNSLSMIESLKSFAATFSRNLTIAGDEERLKLHIAAVIVNNFTNHLYTLAADYCVKESADFTLLLPLVHETVNRLQYGYPGQMQTGPAIRGDSATISQHLLLLEQYPDLQRIYREMTENITHFHRKTVE